MFKLAGHEKLPRRDKTISVNFIGIRIVMPGFTVNISMTIFYVSVDDINFVSVTLSFNLLLR